MNSPIPSLRMIVEETICVADIVTNPVWCLRPDHPSDQALAMLHARDFDVAGIAEEPLTRYVIRDELEPSGTVADFAHLLLASDVVEKSLPLADLIELLGTKPHVFVLDHDCVRWVVTTADLQAPTVSMLALAYLVVPESGVSKLVPNALGDGWFDLLAPDRQKKAHEVFASKVQHNTETGLEGCLYFSDWLSLAGKSRELIGDLGYRSKRHFDDDTGCFSTLRNDLAHGGDLLGSSADAQSAIDRFRRIRSFAARVWDIHERQDGRWDTYAATIISGAGQQLSGPDATAALPFPGPVHVITAWNPDGITRSREVNARANDQLQVALRSLELAHTSVVGTSVDGTWSEESYLVGGLRRSDAASLGERFGQSAIFELTDEKLLVVRCSDASVMRTADRTDSPPA